MRGKLFAVGAVLALGTGCASHQHVRYESPVPAQVVVPAPAPGVVVVPNPAPTTVVVPAITENEAAEIARAEAYRHGWRNVRVERAAYWRDSWHVSLERGGHHPRHAW